MKEETNRAHIDAKDDRRAGSDEPMMETNENREETVAENAETNESQPTISPVGDATPARNIERLLDVKLDVVVRFGTTSVPLRDVARMGVGTMIELDRGVEEPVELLVNGKTLARGEVVVVDGYYGVRITEIAASSERALSLL